MSTIIEAWEFIACPECIDINKTLRPMSGKPILCEQHAYKWPDPPFKNNNANPYITNALTDEARNRLLFGVWEVHCVPLNIGDAYKAFFDSSKLRYIGEQTKLYNETFIITNIETDYPEYFEEGIVLCTVVDEEKHEYQFINKKLALIQ